MTRNNSRTRWMLRKFIRLIFGRRCITIKGEASVPLRFPPAEYPSLFRGFKKLYPQLKQEWIQLLGDHERIFDIGANIGLTVQRFYSILNGKCSIWAFEPMLRNFELLEINSRALASNSIFVFNNAVGNYNGEIIFSDNLEHGGLSRIAATFSNPHRSDDLWDKCTEVKAKIVTLDTFLGNHQDACPSFVKIDVEGAGALVLEGARNMLKQYRPVISSEFHTSDEREGMCQILEEAEYRGIVFHEDGTLCWCDAKDSKGTFIHPHDPRVVRLNLGKL